MKKESCRLAVVALVNLIAIATASVAIASPSPLGSEFNVNFTLTGNQENPDVAVDAVGNFVICWEGNGAGDSSGIYAHRYNSDGSSLGSDFLVNTITEYGQGDPAIAMTGGGKFIIAWNSYELNSNPANYYYNIRTQSYSSAGNVIGASVRYANNLRDNYTPSISINQQGTFFLAWSAIVSGSFTPQTRYDIYGGIGGSNTVLNDPVNFDQNQPAVAIRKSESTTSVVVWHSNGQDGSGGGIYANASNRGIFRVNSTTANSQSNPSVSMDANGNFVVVWQSLEQDGSGYGIFGQRYSVTATPVGGEFRINNYRVGDQTLPSVDINPGGEFVVIWESNGQDGSGQGIYARRYFSNGAPRDDDEFRVNTYTVGNQTNPKVAIDNTGAFVAVWQSTGQDSSGEGIFAQRFASSNLPPQVASIAISPSAPNTTNDLIASVSASDPDNDTFNIAYQWQESVDGFNYSDINGATTNSLVGLLTVAGRYYRFKATPADSIAGAGGTATSGSVHIPEDSDGDGLNDDYEITYFGSLTAQSGGDDADGDGATNAQEQLAGTSPIAPTSVFRLSMAQRAGNSFTITFPTVAGRVYRVQRSVSLLQWEVVSGGISGTGNDVEYTDVNSVQPGNPQRFYRVQVSLP